jgi:hypothetical protein
MKRSKKMREISLRGSIISLLFYSDSLSFYDLTNEPERLILLATGLLKGFQLLRRDAQEQATAGLRIEE